MFLKVVNCSKLQLVQILHELQLFDFLQDSYELKKIKKDEKIKRKLFIFLLTYDKVL